LLSEHFSPLSLLYGWSNLCSLAARNEKSIRMKTLQFVWAVALMFMIPLWGFAQMPEYGNAVYYADYLHGKATASGEKYDKYELTAAHKTHPFGTLLNVTRLDNYLEVTVRVNDRGPYAEGCVVDLSWAAADKLDLLIDGKVEVKVEVVGASGVAEARPVKIPEGADPVSTLLGDMAKANSAFGNNVTASAPTQPDATVMETTPDIPEDQPVAYSAAAPRITIKSPDAFAPAESVDNLWLDENAKGYGVQVGSYSTRENALRRANELKASGMPDVHIKQKYHPSRGELYKIVVGKFDSQEDATEYKAILQGRYKLAGFVVNRTF
jgi:rare lipoprotein A